MNKKQRKWRNRIMIALGIFLPVFALTELAPLDEWLGSKQAAVLLEFALFLVPYLIAGYDVLRKAWLGIVHHSPFDESLLMAIATLGAFGLVFFPEGDPHMAEGAAVMLFYQVGELFQSYAVSKSRKSIADMMDIAPEFANLERDGAIEEVDPYEVAPGDVVVIKPGERVPLDGTVLEGESDLDASALTGESVPRKARAGEDVISGCVNLSGVLRVRVSKPYDQSTVQRILELVENASDKKARTENFITRFARIYTPVVTIAALVLAIIPPLALGESFPVSIERALTFLVVSCPCALVISVPLSFFGGIGGASRHGILIKGGNYLEALSQVDTVVFDKTGTLTTGTFQVVEISTAEGVATEDLLEAAAAVESLSNHPIAQSIRAAYRKTIDQTRVSQVEEVSGHGVKALLDGVSIIAGNHKFMDEEGISVQPCSAVGTAVYVARAGQFLGSLVIADTLKDDARTCIETLHHAGVRRCIMLTGDRHEVAEDIASRLGLDEFHAQLLPQDKVSQLEQLLSAKADPKKNVAFVGDGINDAPVLTRSDVGIAMGAMGSDAAIEAADVVLMDDKPSNIALGIRIARKTMNIARQNIVFALGVKLLVLVLAAFGLAGMWAAVFADVGVAVLAILNAMRCMTLK